MNRLEFTIRGLTRSRARTIRHTLSPPIGREGAGIAPAKLFGLPLVAVVAIAALAEPSAVVNGMTIRADRLLLAIDTSGSMGQFRTETDAALLAIRSDGLSLRDSVPIGGSDSGIPDLLRRELAARPGVDAVYIISDFNDATDLIVGADSTGYRTVLRLLRYRSIRLYLSTVNLTPCQDQVALTDITAGDWNSLADNVNPSSNQCP